MRRNIKGMSRFFSLICLLYLAIRRKVPLLSKVFITATVALDWTCTYTWKQNSLETCQRSSRHCQLNKCPPFMNSAWVKVNDISLYPIIIITIILHDYLTAKACAGLSVTHNHKTGVWFHTKCIFLTIKNIQLNSITKTKGKIQTNWPLLKRQMSGDRFNSLVAFAYQAQGPGFCPQHRRKRLAKQRKTQ